MNHETNRFRDPRIAVIGGGTGLSTMLRGLKKLSRNITAIVTVADDGGGSGMLRADLGMPPPGDVRNCIQALANTEPIMEKLLAYRFTEGSLKGQSFGNLFLAALNGMSDTFDEAVRRMSDVLAITGRVLPVTNENVYLAAEFSDGSEAVGESHIAEFKKGTDKRIARVRLIPERPRALPEALEAIRGGGHDSPRPGQPLHVHHAEPRHRRGGGGRSALGRLQDLRPQRHDPGRRDGGLHRERPHLGALLQLRRAPLRLVPRQLPRHPGRDRRAATARRARSR